MHKWTFVSALLASALLGLSAACSPPAPSPPPPAIPSSTPLGPPPDAGGPPPVAGGPTPVAGAPDQAPAGGPAEEFYNRGQTKLGQQDLQGALDDFTLALQLNPALGAAYYQRGVVNS